MKNLMNKFLILIALGAMTSLYSCLDDNEAITPDLEDEFDARLNANATDSLTATVFVTDVTDGTINILTTFVGEDIKRVYIIKEELGQGEVKVDAKDEFGADDKGDGSIDVINANSSGVAYAFDIPLTSLPSEDGTVIYKFWATSGKGDHRDATKNGVTSPYTLTINLGGTNPASVLVSVSDVQLFAPTADLMSQSFASTADGIVYSLDDFENSDLWDLGYTAQGNVPQLTSAFESPQRFFQPGSTSETESFQELIERETGASADELNMVYFLDIDDTFDFDGASVESDFSDLAVSTSDAQAINIPLDASGDLIAFIDQYGKKGVIRIDGLTNGGGDDYFNADDYVQIDIKVQR